MDKEDSIRLIQLYGSFKMLWDSKDPDHLNKSKREDCWMKISKEMKLPIPELKKKLDSLTASYRREKSKQRKSNITGSGADEIYISKWFGFKYFDFMSNKDDTGITKEGGIDIVSPLFMFIFKIS
ncbi:unnamed protein product [Parnassius mnemosyne]|uniref:MADF domain-containing protein n=1 Tax=Parnassius mnemosyne TaxID=213953 RepID=A0AAV1LF72_9NEOP